MKVVAILCWYDESPNWLSACVASLQKVPVDHLVAVDGAYALFPDARARSGIEQTDAITRTCDAMGLGLTLYQPTEPWAGNEVEKRTMSLRLARQITEPWTDWFLVIDADEVVTHCALDFRQQLAQTECHVATYGLSERLVDVHDWNELEEFARKAYLQPSWQTQTRSLYRALPGLQYDQAHYCVKAELDGGPIYLFGHEEHEQVPAEDLSWYLRLEHRNHLREKSRAQAAKSYYRVRDELGIERLDALAETPGFVVAS